MAGVDKAIEKAKKVAKAKAKKTAAKFVAKMVGWFMASWVGLGLIMILLIASLVVSADAQAQNGQCLAGGDFQASKKTGPNPAVVNAIWGVLQKKNASETVQLATFETALDESGGRNIANDGHHGPEDDTGTASTAAQLAAAGHSMDKNDDGTDKYPHDYWHSPGDAGTDHASVGVFQQQVGPGFGWATADSLDGQLKQLLDPAYAAGKFVDKAISYEPRYSDAGSLASAVQVGGAPSAYASFQQQAQGLITQAKNGTAGGGGGDGSGTPVVGVSNVTCSSPGGLLVSCGSQASTDAGAVAGTPVEDKQKNGKDTGSTDKNKQDSVGGDGDCTVRFTNHDPTQSTNGQHYVISLPVDQNGQVNEAGKAIAAAAAMVDKGLPYSWGGGGINGPSLGIAQGASTYGFDCSGLMEYAVYKGTNGRIDIGGSTYVQKPNLKSVSSPTPGDMIFLLGMDHVVMYVGKMKYDAGSKTWTSASDGSGTPMVIAAPQTGEFLHVQPMYLTGFSGYGHPAYKGLVSTSGKPA